MPHRASSPLGVEPFAEGGSVLTRLAKSVLGKPDTVKIPGVGEIGAHPIKEFEDVAAQFAKRYGNEYPIQRYPEFDEDRARQIAAAYDAMKHDPADPRVKRSYDALIDETMDQYRALSGTGAKFEFLKPGEGDPYAASPSLGYHDLITNGRLKVFPTDQGFGTLNDISDNPLLRRVGRVGDLDNATANDAFRVVHDALGHFGPGNPFFRHQGEERAWNAHSRSFSPDALPAATSETRGQNSWVNFGPHAEGNRGASGADTTYADQKTGLLPDWMYETPKYGEGGAVLKNARRFLIDPLRESFPGIYKNPNALIDDAKEHLVPDPGKEGPMYRLFGHTRDSLDELSQGDRRFDTITPALGVEHPVRLSGTADISPNVLTRRNAGRLSNIIGEALDDPQLRTTRSWYEMSPLYDRMNQLGTGDAAMKKLNNTMAVMSAGSDPRTEINRGFHANWLANEGRLDDFIRHGGTPDHERDSDFPDDLRSILGHAYHGSAQVPGLLESQFAGRPWPGQGRHKVPTYAAATDPVHPYSARPVADSHFNRILGYPDVATATTRAGREGVPTGTQYADIVPWFNKIAEGVDTRPRDAQALLWNVGGPQTGVRYIGPPKLEMIADYMDEVAKLRQIDPRKARDQLLSGEIGGAWDHGTEAPFARGGHVDDFDNAYQSQYYGEGGLVERLARAAKLGFDTSRPWYHSALSPIDQFEPHGKFMGRSGISGIHLVDSPEVASRYLDRYGDIDYKGDPFTKNIMPLYANPGRSLRLQPDERLQSSIQMGAPLPEGYTSPLSGMGYDSLRRMDAISRRGSVRHVDPGSPGSMTHEELVLNDPSRVRSIFDNFEDGYARGGSVDDDMLGYASMNLYDHGGLVSGYFRS